MNLTLHIIRKDLRALRWGMLLWVAACLTHLGLRLAQLARGDTAALTPFWRGIESTNRWDYTALIVLPILLIPLLLHLDPLRGALAFWKTLPISRRRLFTAKSALLLVFFFALPFACEAVYFVKAGLSAVLATALADWAWRFLPGLAAVVLGCFFTRSLKVGVPCVAALLWLAAHFLQWPYGRDRIGSPLTAASVPRPGIIAAPPGVRIEFDPKSVSFQRGTHEAETAPGKPRQIEEVLSVELKVGVTGLPEDVLVGGVGVNVTAIHLPGRVVNSTHSLAQGRPSAFAESRFLPVQERRAELGSREQMRNLGPNIWSASTFYFDIAAKELAPAGALVEGKALVGLVRRRPVSTLPLVEGARWQPGLHRLTLADVAPPDARQMTYRATLATILADPRGATGGLALTPQTNFALWLEHDALPLRKHLQFISASAWRNGPPAEGSPSYGNSQFSYAASVTADITRSRKRTEYGVSFDPVQALNADATPLSVARFAEEQAQVRNWHLAIVTYENLGMIELPFKTVVPRPQRAGQSDDGGDELKPAPPALSTMLDEVKIPAHPSRAEAEQIFARIAELGTARGEDEVRRHEDLLWKKLAALGADNAEVLLAAATEALRRVPRSESSPSNQREWVIEEGDWQRSTAFWRRVLIAACDLARPGDEALFLRYHSPTVSLLRAIKPRGWSAAALPAMCAAAMSEPVSNEWQDFMARNPGPQTGAALLAQIRQRAVWPGRVAEFIALGAVPARAAADALWDTAVASTGSIEELTPAFPLAVKHGVEIVPRDLLRLLRLKNDEQSRSYKTSFKTLQSSFVQSFSLRSDCPPIVAEAAPWLEENALLLQFNDTTGRYELPGKTTPAPVLAAWGEYIDPLGGGRVRVEGEALELTAAGILADYWQDVGKRTSPRIMREVEGDFTAEVTVQPAFNLSKPWNDNRDSIFQSAGLLVDAGAPRTIRWEHAVSKTADNHELRDETMRSGRSTVLQHASDKWNRAKPVRLRIARHGDLFTTAWQQEDGAWVETPAQRNLGWPRKVRLGVFLVNNCTRPLSARFSNLKIETVSAAPLVLAEPIVPHPSGEPTPDGTALGKWGSVGNPVGAGIFKLEGGTLSIDVQPKVEADYNIQSHTTAPCVLSEIEGDFTLEATIAPTPRKKWQSGDLIITSRPDFYLRVGVGNDGKLLFHNWYADSGWPANIHNLEAKRDMTKPLRIRLQRRGWMLTIAHQQEGGEWVEFYPVYLATWPPKIRAGVVALNTTDEPFTAVFTDFKLTHDAPPP